MEDKKRIVFYSWQSDLPSKTNWGFIQEALERAIKAIHKDDEIEIKPVIDRDTQGVAGSPDISKTIFNKIRQADIFVGDVSIIGSVPIGNNAFRAMPNPNVLVELGYALGVLSEDRIVMVANQAFGKLESLPFDLRPRRVLGYDMPVESEPASARKVLQDKLTVALTEILKQLDKQQLAEIVPVLPLAEQAQNAIKEQNPEQTALVQQYMSELANTIQTRNPIYDSPNEERCAEQLRTAIDKTVGVVEEFSRLAQSIIMRNADRSLKALYRGFEHVLNLYTFSPTYQGQRFPYVPDLARFLGHELFVTVFSYLLREERWQDIVDILEEDLFARPTTSAQPTLVPFHLLSNTVRLLQKNYQNQLMLRPTSLHMNLLVERHSNGELAKLVPIEQFAEADYFLFLRAQIQPPTSAKNPSWMPWSSLYIQQVPRFLQTAKYSKYAERLLKPLSVVDIPTLRTRLVERTGSLEEGWGYIPTRPWDNIIAGFDFGTIGTL